MTRLQDRAWTMYQDRFLVEHWDALSDREMAQALGRTETAVTCRRPLLGLKRAETGRKGRGTRPWSVQDDETIRRLFATGASDDDMAMALGRTSGSIAQRRSALGLRRADSSIIRPEGQPLWTDEDDSVLGILFRRGKSDQEIGKALDRTACAVKDRRQSLDLWRVSRR